MESRIKKLSEKYWAGETSLEEEAELKEYYKQNPSLTQEGQYFRQVKQLQNEPNIRFSHPAKIGMRARWSVAAAVTVGLIAAVLVLEDARNQDQFAIEDPQEAYEITKKALMMVSSGLNEGKKYSKEITKLNEAEELVTNP